MLCGVKSQCLFMGPLEEYGITDRGGITFTITRELMDALQYFLSLGLFVGMVYIDGMPKGLEVRARIPFSLPLAWYLDE